MVSAGIRRAQGRPTVRDAAGVGNRAVAGDRVSEDDSMASAHIRRRGPKWMGGGERAYMWSWVRCSEVG